MVFTKLRYFEATQLLSKRSKKISTTLTQWASKRP